MDPRTRLILVVAGLACTTGCASLRQNLRGQELSYRGSYACPTAEGCSQPEMKRSTVGTTQGSTLITTVKAWPTVGMAFTAERNFDSLSATVRDCKGKQLEVPADRIVAAGEHDVGDADARESWMVVIDPRDLPGLKRAAKGDCAVWMVDVTAKWSDGATYAMRVGLEIGAK